MIVGLVPEHVFRGTFLLLDFLYLRAQGYGQRAVRFAQADTPAPVMSKRGFWSLMAELSDQLV